ncbi:Cys-tRNA(Pro) deacylase [Priestia koreensis]|uniref:Cys-tRNA(Pro) deacylase n=1 Tax=Priestia koreensis TaxID=284581 RepID=UPI001F59A56A|nr:Cys-tRNA(Pro) deacylase [Priestia koreensis]UNL83751.1 Cys-tRNA(Pro) deacylase [Priestia koreensis]
MSKKTEKTNVMRVLDQKNVAYNHYSFDSKSTSGAEVARSLGEDPHRVFKTLVTIGKSNEHYVFMVPIDQELDFKKGAQAAKEKAIEMIPQKALLPLTGYIHGGCSPIGMKKPFKTFIHESAETFSSIFFSAGKVGHQVELSLSDLQQVISVTTADLVKES